MLQRRQQRTKVPPPYKSVGCCIYCSIPFPEGKLGLEHIIPRSIGGELKLPHASCVECGRATSRIEVECVRTFFVGARVRYDIRENKIKKKRDFINIDVEYVDKIYQEKILRSEYPGFLPVYAFPPPGILLGALPCEGMTGYLIPIALYPDNEIRSQAHTQKPIVLGRNFRAETYARLLAKIGHAYTVAELGMGNFQPYLTDLVRGIPPLHPSRFIGGIPSEAPPSGVIPPPGNERHEIGFVAAPARNSNLIVVRVRLFSDAGGLVHYVVTGERSS